MPPLRPPHDRSADLQRVACSRGRRPRGQVPRRAGPRRRGHGRGGGGHAHRARGAGGDQVPAALRRAEPGGRRPLLARGARRRQDQERARGPRHRRRDARERHCRTSSWSTSRGCDLSDVLAARRAAARRATRSTTCSRRARRSPRRTRSGFVHRDLKPANLFLAQQADGIASSRCSTSASPRRSSARASPRASGASSPARPTSSARRMYMSPEQLKSARDVDARADIWALGVDPLRADHGRGALRPAHGRRDVRRHPLREAGVPPRSAPRCRRRWSASSSAASRRTRASASPTWPSSRRRSSRSPRTRRGSRSSARRACSGARGDGRVGAASGSCR